MRPDNLRRHCESIHKAPAAALKPHCKPVKPLYSNSLRHIEEFPHVGGLKYRKYTPYTLEDTSEDSQRSKS